MSGFASGRLTKKARPEKCKTAVVVFSILNQMACSCGREYAIAFNRNGGNKNGLETNRILRAYPNNPEQRNVIIAQTK
jgi:hypothetical protein